MQANRVVAANPSADAGARAGGARWSGPGRWLGPAVAAIGVASVASAQMLFDFETDLEGWAEVTFPEAGQVVNAAQSTIVATSGTGSMAVSKTPDAFSWTVQMGAGTGTFYSAITDAVNDTSNTYELVFDMIFRAADVPGAGGTSTTYLNSLVAMSSDTATNQNGETISGGWNQTSAAFGLGGADITALTDTRALEVRIPLATFNLTPGSGYYELTLSLNGDYGSNATATVYYDNVRLEPLSSIFFDFTDGLDGWMFDELCGDVALAPNVPPGDQSLQLVYTDFGPCRAGVVTKGPGDGHPMYRLIRDAVRDNPANYTLDFDLILLVGDMPADATFLNPMVTFNADDGMSWQQQILTDHQIDLTTIDSDTIIPLKIPLTTWLWPNTASWNPTFIQMGLGTEVDSGFSYSFYFDNFAIRPLVVEPPPRIIITGLDLQPDGAIALSWGSVSDAVYAVSRATDLVAGDWTQIASNLVAGPPVNTWTNPAATSAMELYRVSPFSNERMISLFDFEEGTDGWVASATSISVTNSDVIATTGSNSLAVTVGSADFWKVNWTAGYDTNNPTFVSIRNALLDTNETWYIAVDFIYHGPSINATNSPPPGYYNQQVAFNSDTGGWVDNPNIALLEGGPIAALGTNSIVITWSYELLDTGWGTTTNGYYQMNIGLSADFANMSAATLHYDNFRLTNKPP